MLNFLSRSGVNCVIAVVCIGLFGSAGYWYQLRSVVVAGDYSFIGANRNNPIVVFSRTDCSACQDLKVLFSGQSVPVQYIELDLTNDPDDFNKFSKLGYKQVPIIVLSDKLILGFHKAAILAELSTMNKDEI